MLFSCLENVSDVEVKVCANYVSLILYEGWQKKKTKQTLGVIVTEWDKDAEVRCAEEAGLDSCWPCPDSHRYGEMSLDRARVQSQEKNMHVMDALIWCSLEKKTN